VFASARDRDFGAGQSPDAGATLALADTSQLPPGPALPGLGTMAIASLSLAGDAKRPLGFSLPEAPQGSNRAGAACSPWAAAPDDEQRGRLQAPRGLSRLRRLSRPRLFASPTSPRPFAIFRALAPSAGAPRTATAVRATSATPPSPALAGGLSPTPSRLAPFTPGTRPLTGLPSDREAASLPSAELYASDAARIAGPCSAPATPTAREGGARSEGTADSLLSLTRIATPSNRSPTADIRTNASYRDRSTNGPPAPVALRGVSARAARSRSIHLRPRATLHTGAPARTSIATPATKKQA
jgi:hypothetical protein